jgi:catechol 2,3-dioxygenase-like lactoylglutathione lyase family enzyme
MPTFSAGGKKEHMPVRFDHAVIGVSDLDEASACFQRLGFAVRPGGRHADGGTYNALVRFDLDYVELLATYDQEMARASGRTVEDELRGRKAGLIGYALATTTIEQDAERFTGAGVMPAWLRPMGRKRPDGTELTWRVLAPDDILWGQPWPFLIQWNTSDAERLHIDRAGHHLNGVYCWHAVSVAVRDLASAQRVYHDQLGLLQINEDTSTALNARRATFTLGANIIDVLAPAGSGVLQQVLANEGEGPYELTFAVHELDQTRAFLEARGIDFVQEPGERKRLRLSLHETMGLALSLVEAP